MLAARGRHDTVHPEVYDQLTVVVRGVPDGEAFDLLQALNTGHSGSLSTIHANSAEQALARFASCVLQSGIELPYQATRRLIGESIDLVVHLERWRGARSVAEVIRVLGYGQEVDAYDLQYLDVRCRRPGAS